MDAGRGEKTARLGGGIWRSVLLLLAGILLEPAGLSVDAGDAHPLAPAPRARDGARIAAEV
jgi:hypothetical protein